MATNASVRRLKAHGRFPKFVYRAFTQKSYAEDFALRGSFRLGNLRMYPGIKAEERRDASEGHGHFQHLGIVTSVDFVAGSDETRCRRRQATSKRTPSCSTHPSS